MSNEIKIVIRGRVNSGKSIIAHVIQKILREYNFEISLTDPDFGNDIELFHEHFSKKDIDSILKGISPDHPVSIKILQENRKVL